MHDAFRNRVMGVGALLSALTIVTASCGADVRDDSRGADAAVAIVTEGCQPVQVGSGAVIGDDLVLTAAHVVAGTRIIEVTTSTGSVLEATPVVIDSDADVALLRVRGIDVTPLPVATGRVYETAGVVLPRSSQLIAAPLVQPVWAVTTDIYLDHEVVKLALELEFEALTGDSGAAVIDGSGAVVGLILSAVRDRNISFALHVEEFRDLLDDVPTSRSPRGSCTPLPNSRHG